MGGGLISPKKIKQEKGGTLTLPASLPYCARIMRLSPYTSCIRTFYSYCHGGNPLVCAVLSPYYIIRGNLYRYIPYFPVVFDICVIPLFRLATSCKPPPANLPPPFSLYQLCKCYIRDTQLLGLPFFPLTYLSM